MKKDSKEMDSLFKIFATIQEGFIIIKDDFSLLFKTIENVIKMNLNCSDRIDTITEIIEKESEVRNLKIQILEARISKLEKGTK